MTKSQSVKPVDPLHSFMEALERMEGLPTDTRHHILFMVAVLVGKLEGTLGLPELGISPSFDLILSWGNLQVIITPTQDDDPMFTVGAIDGVWAYVVQTPFEVVQHLEKMYKFGVPELPPDKESLITRFKNYLLNVESKAPKIIEK